MTPDHEGPSDAEIASPESAGANQPPQSRSAPDWRNLTDTLTRELDERIAAAGGDPAQFNEAWADLVAAYGPRGAHNIVRIRAGQLLGAEVDPELSEKLAHLALSRENFLPSSPSPQAAIPGLPRSGGEYRAAGGFEMPPQVRVRAEAASNAMRRELAKLYANPITAEARLHVIVTTHREGRAFAAQIAIDPGQLGTLRQGVAGDQQALAPALAHARVAYALHLAPTPDHAVDLMSREAVVAVQRAAAEVERASRALDRAIDLHGPALGAHLQELRSGIVSRQGPARRAARADDASELDRGAVDEFPARVARGAMATPDWDEPMPREFASAPARPGADSPIPPDPAVEEASRAHLVLEEARILEKRGEEIRRERGDAQSILAVLDFDDHEQLRTRRDVDALAAKVYQHPQRAVERWNTLVKDLGGDMERARKIVVANPGRLGALHSEPAGLVARLPLPGWVVDRIPFRSTAEAQQHVSRLAEKAVDYSKARAKVEEPVEWASPDGKRLYDRAEVRAAAREVDKGLGTEIERNEAALLARGNLKGAEREAQRAVGSLRPEQRDALARKLAAARGVPAAEMSAALSRLAAAPRVAAQAARALRVAGEGPGQSL
jgi:hypothetical protein